jgi:hypothetical protein
VEEANSPGSSSPQTSKNLPGMMNNFVKNTRFPCYRDLSNPFVKMGTDNETPATGTTMLDHLRMFKDTYNN